ncbi:MAG: hypothetical protein ACM3TU_00405 [Bacillota bacterium]
MPSANQTKALSYDQTYHFSFSDGMTEDRIFRVLRLRRHLKNSERLVKLAIYTETDWPHESQRPTAEGCLGVAHAEIEGVHHDEANGNHWFVLGRFRNDLAQNAGQLTEGPWKDAFFYGSIELDCTMARPGRRGTLKTSRTSFLTNPFHEGETGTRS